MGVAGVDPSLRQFADDVIDRLLARGEALFPDVEQAIEFKFGATPAGAGTPPGGGVALADRLEEAHGQWARQHGALQDLDEQGTQIVAAAAAVAAEGRAAVQRLREQARAQVDAMMPVADSPAGTQLVVSTLDQIVGQVQQHVAASRRAYTDAAAQLRELAAGYRDSI